MSELHDDRWFQDFRRRLAHWYNNNRRPLPWRETKDPYAIWISEIMLQQTQVATVIEYFQRFMKRFPDIESLALADEDAVLGQWSGLGYYRRARALHAAAKIMLQQHAGKFPTDYDDVLRLPGVGRYTAGAITSIAFDSRKPILEANTLRLFARLTALRDDPLSSTSQQKLWGFAQAILPNGRGSGRVNQAAMELGSLVCTPKAPACPRCAIRKLCPAFELGVQTEIPPPKSKPQITEEIHALAVTRRGSKFLMRRNQQDEWWTGLWDFPRLKISHLKDSRALTPNDALPQTQRELVESEFQSILGLPCNLGSMLFKLTHGVTRFRIRLLCFTVDVPPRLKVSQLDGDWKWMSLLSQTELPLTSPARQVLDKLR